MQSRNARTGTDGCDSHTVSWAASGYGWRYWRRPLSSFLAGCGLARGTGSANETIGCEGGAAAGARTFAPASGAVFCQRAHSCHSNDPGHSAVDCNLASTVAEGFDFDPELA